MLFWRELVRWLSTSAVWKLRSHITKALKQQGWKLLHLAALQLYQLVGRGYEVFQYPAISVLVVFLKHRKAAQKHKQKCLHAVLAVCLVMLWIPTTGFTDVSVKKKSQNLMAAHNIFACVFHTQHMAITQIAAAKC